MASLEPTTKNPSADEKPERDVLYLATPLAFNPTTEGSPGTICVKFYLDVKALLNV